MVKKLTPAQQQYHDLKAQYPDCILFFRLGDFYETFGDDALLCAKLLDLTVTTREKNAENPLPMAGIPYHAAEKYIPKLIAFGHKVAVAEQMTAPKAGQIVERAVTHVVTPATHIDEGAKEYTYICAVTYTGGDRNSYQCARGDVTVGMYWTRSFRTLEELMSHVHRLQPRELIIDVACPQHAEIQTQIKQVANCLVSTYDKPTDSEGYLCALLGVQTLASFGKALEE
jgi:DNA mismatch repair protein MutS